MQCSVFANLRRATCIIALPIYNYTPYLGIIQDCFVLAGLVSFDNSANSNFLQLADIVAYNVWRQFVEYGDEWDNHSPEGEHRELPMYPYFERISNCFYHDRNNKVSGCGIVKLPDPYNKQKGWNIE